MDPLTGTLIATGVQTAGNIIAGATAAGMSYKKTKKLAEYAYSKDLEMWNRQNAYNSPQAQMLRLEAAGLNPNLVYGGGAGSAVGQAREMPRYNAPTAKYDFEMPNVLGALGMYQDLMVKQAQVDNLRAQTQNVNQRTLNEGVNNVIKTNQAELLKATLPYKIETEGWKGLERKYKSGELYWKGELAKGQAEAIKWNNAYVQRINNSRLDLLGQQIVNAQKENNWYTANALTSILSKALGVLGIGGLVGNLTKKQPVIIKR